MSFCLMFVMGVQGGTKGWIIMNRQGVMVVKQLGQVSQLLREGVGEAWGVEEELWLVFNKREGAAWLKAS